MLIPIAENKVRQGARSRVERRVQRRTQVSETTMQRNRSYFVRLV